jgi:hypothetical protein
MAKSKKKLLVGRDGVEGSIEIKKSSVYTQFICPTGNKYSYNDTDIIFIDKIINRSKYSFGKKF